MSTTQNLADDVALARTSAHSAAERSGIDIRMLETTADFEAASRLLDGIWRSKPGGQQMPPEHLRALTHARSYAAGCYVDGDLVGASVGFFGPPRSATLHSHITGVAPTAQGRGAGYALKLHQRAWALDNGVHTITWTFDPVVRRNAHFNLSKLGARPSAYHVDFYGNVADGINVGQGSDRLVAAWDLLSAPVRTALGERRPGSGPAAPSDGRGTRAVGSAGSRPVAVDLDELRHALYVVVETPRDIEALRRDDPDAAFAWRLALRDALGELIDSPARFVCMSQTGSYHFERNAK